MGQGKNYQINQPPRMYEQVMNQLVEYIQSESLPKGEKIPPERNLSELLGVSRSSIREGIRGLELLGYLHSKQGGGTFVANPPKFLIPTHVLGQSLGKAELQNYYDIFLMCSQHIVFLSLSSESLVREAYGNISPEKGFWSNFSLWIEHIGANLMNTYYLDLYLTNYKVLEDNGYFSMVHVDIHIQAFIESYIQGDRKKLKNLFNHLTTL
ncbi:FadR/GntR family transcriptional regulator [Priestia endophytica]|uniref:FadR/GntR family transcriptional regulator n=1 Tax=Priestia endophytica TaxID=135735 RepID=UPI000DCA653A|nr:GntR family transcriptional regulator [Priestia endophytica]RAS85824.1 hypothetical protein A4U60_08950 [Priestia endophytica]